MNCDDLRGARFLRLLGLLEIELSLRSLRSEHAIDPSSSLWATSGVVTSSSGSKSSKSLKRTDNSLFGKQAEVGRGREDRGDGEALS